MDILNIDTNFLSKPYARGNLFVTQDYQSTTDYLTSVVGWIQSKSIPERIGVKYYVKSDTSSSVRQLLGSYQKLFESNFLEKDSNLVHIGAHLNIYSYFGPEEYFELDNIAQYGEHNAFVYLFKKGFLKTITWVVPDWFTDTEIADHFAPMDTYIKNGFYIVSINQALRIPIKVVRWSGFIPTQYKFKYYSLILNKNNSKYTPDDVTNLKNIGFR
jgi:hypothetical protein